VPLEQRPHGLDNIVAGGKADQLGRHVTFDSLAHDSIRLALRMIHSLQLPQLPHSGRCLRITPSASPATASMNSGIAIINVVISEPSDRG
jgi:hypothetical protein